MTEAHLASPDGSLDPPQSVETHPCRAGKGLPALAALQIGQMRTEIIGEEQVARDLFSSFNALHLSSIFEPALLKSLLAMCDASQWQPEPEAAGFREVEVPQRAGRVVNLVLNRPSLLRWIERVTGCRLLSGIEGRVTRMLHRPGDRLYWHDDILGSDGRQLAIVINLGSDPFEGGEFLMRPKGGDVLFTHSHQEPGSALLFRVHPTLEHCVRPLTSGGPRRVYAAAIIPVSPSPASSSPISS